VKISTAQIDTINIVIVVIDDIVIVTITTVTASYVVVVAVGTATATRQPGFDLTSHLVGATARVDGRGLHVTADHGQTPRQAATPARVPPTPASSDRISVGQSSGRQTAALENSSDGAWNG